MAAGTSKTEMIENVIDSMFPDATCDECGGIRASYYDEAVGVSFKYGGTEPEPCSCEEHDDD